MKIEFDIPEFKKELKIEVTIRRDGEVIYSAHPNTAEDMEIKPEPSTKTKAQSTSKKSGGSSKGGGNMMNIEEL